MRHAAFLFFGRLCGCDLNFLVDLYRIAIDDLAANGESKLNAKRGFTRGRRPCNRVNEPLFGVSNQDKRIITWRLAGRIGILTTNS